MWLRISKVAEMTKGVISAAGLKKAVSDGRIRAKKIDGAWVIDTHDEQVAAWVRSAGRLDASGGDEMFSEMSEEIRLKDREIANLSKRVRQAEAAQRRMEREMKKLREQLSEERRQHAEEIQRNLDRLHDLSQQRDSENARLLVQVASIIAEGVGQVPKREIVAVQPTEDK